MTPIRERHRDFVLRSVLHRNRVRPRGHQVWKVMLCHDHYNLFFTWGFRGEAQWERRMSKNIFKDLEK